MLVTNLSTLSALAYSASLFVLLIVVGASIVTSGTFSQKFTINGISEITKELPLDMIYDNIKMQPNQMLENDIDAIKKPSVVKGVLNFGLPDIDSSKSWLASSIPGIEFYNDEGVVEEVTPPEETLPEAVPPKEEAKAEVPPMESVDEVSDPVVHLYFTHTGEGYENANVDVTDVGDYIFESLESFGVSTCVDDTDVGEILKSKNEKYYQSYDESRVLVEDVMATNNDLEYFVDVHRDSAPKENTTMSYDGKDYAKLSFVIGGDNPNYEENMALANDLSDEMNKLVPGICNGVILKKGAGTNGVFNQDLSNKAILIEVGGVDNTSDELRKTSEVFANAFSNYYFQAESVSGTDDAVSE